MPGTVKVKVLAARNLPVMDRTSFLTDAFVELRLGSMIFKTEVIRRSLNPEWNSDWFCFELGDAALRAEALQIRVLDHDTYSAHDAIGRVYFDLTPLLQAGQKRSLYGWFPLYDTMHGIRGEISLAIRVDMFTSRQKLSSLNVRFFFSPAIPSGYRVSDLIGFVQELVMNDDPEHQWIEKIRSSRASNEARQRLFFQLSGELQRKLSRKVLNLGANAVIGYRLHFDLEGETGVVARAIGTAVYMQKWQKTASPPDSPSIHASAAVVPGVEVDSAPEDTDQKTWPPLGAAWSSTTKLLQSAEFPFLTITHPPPGLIRHFGCAVAAKSVKLLEKNVADDPSVQASWWLELRTEALTHMQHVNCNALIGYREDCAIFEDVCVLSCHATAVHLNSNWVHRPPGGTDRRRPPSGSASGNKVNSEMKAPRSGRISPAKPLPATTTDEAREAYAASVPPPSAAVSADSVPAHTPAFPQNAEPDGSDGATVGSKLLNSEVPSDREVQNCSLCHIPQSDVSQTPQHFTRCSLCKSALVPEFIFSSTEFPSDFPINGRPALIQAGLCRSKKEDKGESAAREVSELLPFIEYELHYRLLQKLKLRGMNAIFGLSFQLSLGENLIALLATGTGVSAKALPRPKPPTVSEPANPHFDISAPASPSTLQQRVFTFSRECYERFGLIGDPKSPSAKQLLHPWTSDSCPATANLDSAVIFAPTSASPPKTSAYEPTPAEHEQVTGPSARFSNSSWDETLAVDQGTYFVDTRDPEPGEVTFLLDDPFPPPSMLLSTTETPGSESVNWLARNLPQRDHTASGDVKTTPKAPTTVCWRPAYSFVKLHYLQGVIPDDALGSVFLNHRASALADQGTAASSPESDYGGAAVACRPSLRNQQSLPDFTQKYHTGGSLVCLADGLRNANRLTWFRFRTLMPCALTALSYRLCITEDSVVQIFNFGCLLVPYCAGSEYANGDRDVIAFCGQDPSPTSPSISRAKHSLGMKGLFSRPLGLLSFRESPSFHSQTHNTDSAAHSTDVHPACTSSLANAESTLPPAPTCPPPIPKSKPHFWSPLTRSAKNLFQIPFKSTSRAATCDPSVSRHARATGSCRQSNCDQDKCLLTPLAYIPNYEVTSYFGNISFFFVRETTDLREMGGLRCFVHASVADAQSVISAHTISFGGNALLSYHISELLIIRPPSRNQAQCILNLCGDMAYVTPVV
ncbi:hypothetical protein AAHC03_01841 [Spirometra sp. Aus1]